MVPHRPQGASAGAVYHQSDKCLRFEREPQAEGGYVRQWLFSKKLNLVHCIVRRATALIFLSQIDSSSLSLLTWQSFFGSWKCKSVNTKVISVPAIKNFHIPKAMFPRTKLNLNIAPLITNVQLFTRNNSSMQKQTDRTNYEHVSNNFSTRGPQKTQKF